MPVTYSIQGGLLRLDCVGVYPSSDLMVQFLAAINDPSCPPVAPMLMDVSRSDSLTTRASDEIRTVAEFLGPHAARIGGRCAIIAPQDAQFGLSQMGAVYSEDVGIEARVFRSDEAAIEWLTSDR